ncbi:MAG: hypothetical protein ACRDL6_11055 [Solirubrobacterales bacterium]
MKLIIEQDGERIESELSESAVKALEAIAERNDLSFEDALLQALENENFIEDIEASGGRLLFEKDDKIRELVREPA